MTEENESALKHLFGKELLKRISNAVLAVYPNFDSKTFLKLSTELSDLEMKPRVHRIRDQLHELLPKDVQKSVEILRKSAKKAGLGGFDLWPYTEFVQTYGLENLALSLAALSEFTQNFTAEWAIRPFLKRYPKETLAYLETCAQSPQEHLRRWASEGTRPRLPWGERLQDYVKDPKPTLAILEQLKFDESLYVRKSVANHLNDITKNHPEYVIEILKRWKKNAPNAHAEKILWIIHRSLRTLIKNGNAGALALIGVSTEAKVKLSGFKLNAPKIKLGQSLGFSFEIQSLSTKPQKLVIDYIVHFVKANRGHGLKVFKLRTVTLGAKESLSVSKNHAVKKITTREYYPGRHFLEIQINGTILAKKEWELKI